MSEYQVIARKYRPQGFAEVLGQEAIVSTLKNAIKQNRLAQSYLFCGSRGTGKTTLARILAKVLNCLDPKENFEPCNQCASCKEITSGNSLDVLEIDGASNRGIDDIRRINETAAYTTASGKYKIYIIDEVHMLTKEAFNALLKTLEEPPAKVKFFFATTEPHKILPTILSRCQRFNLSRIQPETIVEKLKRIVSDMGYPVEEEALRLIADRAEGGLRDAESLLDQILAFHDKEQITANSVAHVLGVVVRDLFFELDRQGKEGNLAFAFELAHRLFIEGKDLLHFTEMLTEHFRNILMVKLSSAESTLLTLSHAERKKYQETSLLYGKEQCLFLIDYLVEMQGKIRYASSSRIAVEAMLLYVMRSHYRVPVELLVERLNLLEKKLTQNVTVPLPPQQKEEPIKPKAPPPPPAPPPRPVQVSIPSLLEDPLPAPYELGARRVPTAKELAAKEIAKESLPLPPEKQHRYDTLLQFSAVELEGRVQKHSLVIKK